MFVRLHNVVNVWVLPHHLGRLRVPGTSLLAVRGHIGGFEFQSGSPEMVKNLLQKIDMSRKV